MNGNHAAHSIATEWDAMGECDDDRCERGDEEPLTTREDDVRPGDPVGSAQTRLEVRVEGTERRRHQSRKYDQSPARAIDGRRHGDSVQRRATRGEWCGTPGALTPPAEQSKGRRALRVAQGSMRRTA